MGTPYQKVYERFLNQLIDFDLPRMSDSELAAYCLGFMKTAIIHIRPLESNLEARNDSIMEFEEELLEVEIQIIACHMVAEWVGQKLYNSQLVTMFLGTKDEKFNSQANMISALKDLRDVKLAEARTLRRDYQYQHSELMEQEV